MFWVALAVAYVLAVLPADETISIVPQDKINHMIAFLTLAVLAALGWPRAPAWRPALLLTAFGAFIEFSQMIPAIHRDGDFYDLAANIVATLVGLAIGRLIHGRLMRRADALRDP